MLTAVASLKGSAGATTFSVILAAVWPDSPPVVVEVDCSGGDLGAWHWLPDSPGVASLATQSRTGMVQVDQHVRRLPCGVDVVFAAAGRQPATVAVGLLAEADIGLWTKERPTILDVGRLEPGAPNAMLVAQADVVLLISRGDEASLLRLVDSGWDADRVRLVIAGSSPYPVDDITARTGLVVAAQVPWDTRAAAVAAGQRPPQRGWTRRGLPAAARALAVELAAGDIKEEERDEDRG